MSTRPAAVALASLLLLGACGTAPSGTGDRTVDGIGPGAAPTAELPDGPVTYGAEVVALTATAPDRVRATLEVLAGAEGCATRPRVRVEDEGDRSHLTASFRSLPETMDADLDPCPDRAELDVTVRVPATHDVLVTDALDGVAWQRGPGAAYVRCSDRVGCDPPADRCDPAWTGLLTEGTELPPEQRVDVLACADGWLVADVDAVVTGCQSVDGSTPPAGCEGSGVHTRWFARLDPGPDGTDGEDRWTVVASGTGPGCAEVAAVPDFPRTLCRGLPPR